MTVRTVAQARAAAGTGLEIDVGSGPAASYDGLRAALAGLARAGASFDDIPKRYPAEWQELWPHGLTGTAAAGPADQAGPEYHGPVIAELALSASERRLHRESEQLFRVVCAAAAAICRGAAELSVPVALRGIGQADLTSLRGFLRMVEFARTAPEAQLVIVEPGLLSADGVYTAERVRLLERMGAVQGRADVRENGRPRAAVPFSSAERQHFDVAMSQTATACDRLSAALRYCRVAFFSGNWEGMELVARSALGLVPGLSDAQVADVVAASVTDDGQAEAIEFESAILRSATDVTAFLWKVLGIQASFRGDREQALRCFRSMRQVDTGLSAELCAQSCLYAALTLSKHFSRHDEAVSELGVGFAAVAGRVGEPASARRERGWLHNLRGLTQFVQRDLRGALASEKSALDCIRDLHDASSVHLRVNVLSNISVLQENARMFEPALRTWTRFKEASGAYNASFAKHHAYREAGLLLCLGEQDRARAALEQSATAAAALGDDFHECEISLEAGTLCAEDGRAADAGTYFDRARTAAGRLGDPYRIALAMVGQAGAADPPAAPPRDAAEMALRSLTYPAEAAKLASLIDTPSRPPWADMPHARTKLNRPFDLVNF
jgi:tetratricopeptide (TPR) repeat protein